MVNLSYLSCWIYFSIYLFEILKQVQNDIDDTEMNSAQGLEWQGGRVRDDIVARNDRGER